MISDWTFEQSYALLTEKFKEQGFPMPEHGWVYNPQWEDWSFRRGDYRAYVKPDIKTDWSVYDKTDHLRYHGTEAVWQDALLSAEHAVRWQADKVTNDFRERLKFYGEHGYWPGEGPREPDDLKDCYRNVHPKTSFQDSRDVAAPQP